MAPNYLVLECLVPFAIVFSISYLMGIIAGAILNGLLGGAAGCAAGAAIGVPIDHTLPNNFCVRPAAMPLMAIAQIWR